MLLKVFIVMGLCYKIQKGANMSVIKKLQSISEVKTIIKDHSTNTTEIILESFQNFLACKKVQQFGKIKKKGYPAISILKILLLLGISGYKSIRSFMLCGYNNENDIGKDAFYRLKNNENINWRKLLYSFVKRYKYLVSKNIEQNKEKSQTPTCIIADDTVLQKRGRKIENIGKVYDHTIYKSILGFKDLVIGYWDGTTFNPVDFSRHCEKGKNKKYGMKKRHLKERFSKKRNTNSCGFKRIKERNISKMIMLIEHLKRAVKNGFKADYVLFDKWFVSEKIIKAIRKLNKGKMHLIAACKMDRRKYIYKRKEYTARELLRKFNKKYRKRCRSLNYHYIQINVIYKGEKLTLFFNRAFKTSNWELLITTDRALNFKKAMETYFLRWSIEVFFKEAKQYLNYGKSQSQDYNGQIADATLTMIQYIILLYVKRVNYYETLGELFRNVKKSIAEYNLAEKLFSILTKVLEEIAELFELSSYKIIGKIINNEKFKNSIFHLIYYNSESIKS